MILGGNRRRSADLDVDIDMVPVMNMFLVLIPFLLISSSFLHLKAINTSVPVIASTASVNQKEIKKPEIKLTAVVEIELQSIKLTVISEALSEDKLKFFEKKLMKDSQGKYPLLDLSAALQRLKADYPKSDTVILIPNQKTKYNTIVHAMDAARNLGNKPLFKHVVLSGKVG